MGVLAPKGFETLPHQFTALLATLGEIRNQLRLSNAQPTPSAPLPRRHRYALSQATTTLRFSSNLVIVGVVVGGDTAGRGVLQVGTDKSSHIFWLIANQSQPYQFDPEDGILVGPGLDITWIPPSGTTDWDVTLIATER